MNIYRITLYDGATPSYAADMAKAKVVARTDSHRRTLIDTRIDLVDVVTAKAALVVLLNDYAKNGHAVFPVLRTWKMTTRGGVHEITAGE